MFRELQAYFGVPDVCIRFAYFSWSSRARAVVVRRDSDALVARDLRVQWFPSGARAPSPRDRVARRTAHSHARDFRCGRLCYAVLSFPFHSRVFFRPNASPRLALAQRPYALQIRLRRFLDSRIYPFSLAFAFALAPTAHSSTCDPTASPSSASSPYLNFVQARSEQVNKTFLHACSVNMISVMAGTYFTATKGIG